MLSIGKGKDKGRALAIEPLSNFNSYHRVAQVHGAHRAASHIPAFPSQLNWYSFTDHSRMEG